MNQVQPGWDVYDRNGQRLGEVIERDDASVVVARHAAFEGTRLPMKLIADEHPDIRRAELSVTAADVTSLNGTNR
jgi:hypothetical protein